MIRETGARKGYIPLAVNNLGGISWRGEPLADFWMWNRQFTEYRGGIRHIQTVKVTELKEAALKYWRDKWVPIKPVDDDFLRRMEAALRAHQGLKKEGVSLPDGPFLRLPEEIPPEVMGPDVRVYLGLPGPAKKRLVRCGGPSKKIIDAFKCSKLQDGQTR